MDADDYGKIAFEREQAAKAERRRARRQRVPTKEIHLTVGIGDHDLAAKARHARRLLQSRVNVRVSVDGIGPSQEALAETVLVRFLAAAEDAADGVLPAQRSEAQLVAVLWSS
jgi:translation initiation factor IF-3